MSIHTRLTALERAAASSPSGGPRVLTEEEFEDLSYDEKLRYLRGQLAIEVIDEDDGPTWAEACAAAGVVPTVPRPGESAYEASTRVSDAELAVYTQYMDGRMARYAARRAARKAAKGETTETAAAKPAERPPPPPVDAAPTAGRAEVPPRPQAPPADPPPQRPARPAGGCAAGGHQGQCSPPGTYFGHGFGAV